jgi:hypothetical protein
VFLALPLICSVAAAAPIAAADPWTQLWVGDRLEYEVLIDVDPRSRPSSSGRWTVALEVAQVEPGWVWLEALIGGDRSARMSIAVETAEVPKPADDGSALFADPRSPSPASDGGTVESVKVGDLAINCRPWVVKKADGSGVWARGCESADVPVNMLGEVRQTDPSGQNTWTLKAVRRGSPGAKGRSLSGLQALYVPNGWHLNKGGGPSRRGGQPQKVVVRVIRGQVVTFHEGAARVESLKDQLTMLLTRGQQPLKSDKRARVKLARAEIETAVFDQRFFYAADVFDPKLSGLSVAPRCVQIKDLMQGFELSDWGSFGKVLPAGAIPPIRSARDRDSE